MTVGQAVGSPGSSSLLIDSFAKKKINIYNQMAQVLVGHDTTGSIMSFDRDGNPATAGDKFSSLFFFNFSRLLSKDEIKKGSFQMTLGIDTSSVTPFATTCIVSDKSGSTNYLLNSPAGEYGILYTTDISNGAYNPSYTDDASKAIGFVFYQAGIVALSTAIFAESSSTSPSVSMAANSYGQMATGKVLEMSSTYANVETLFQSGSMNDASAALRNRIKNITFNNTTELNSSIHFCRINHNEFNYSSNPTYLKNSKIRVKSIISDAPVSYITTVGLYSPDNELLAVAKLSEPLKKDPTQEMILRVRLDY
jgi:hypothetical protein